MADQDKSLLWVVAMVMLVIALFGWAFLAAAYAHHAEGWRSGGAEDADEIAPGGGFGRGRAVGSMRRVAASSFADFVANAFRQIPNAPQVLAFSFQHRLWLLGLIAGLEGLVLFGGWKLRALDRELSDHPDALPSRRRKKGKPRTGQTGQSGRAAKTSKSPPPRRRPKL